MRPTTPWKPLQSNWTIVPANDNALVEALADVGDNHGEDWSVEEEETDWSVEHRHEITPSESEILREMANDWVCNDVGQVIAIGSLMFSDGSQHEGAVRRTDKGTAVPYMQNAYGRHAWNDGTAICARNG